MNATPYAALAQTIANQAQAIAEGKIPADQLKAQVGLLTNNIETLKAWTPEPRPAVKAPKVPAKRINAGNVGKVLTLRFHGPYERNEDDMTLVKLEGAGDEARATFRDASGMEWEAYRFDGHWAYGSSANRLSVADVK